MKPQLTPKEYAEREGIYCPVCESVDTEGYELKYRYLFGVSQLVHCSSCGADWYETYELMGYVHLCPGEEIN